MIEHNPSALTDISHEGIPAQFIATLLAESLDGAKTLLASLVPDGLTGFILFIAGALPARPVKPAALFGQGPMPVVLAADGMPILRDRVHLAPAGVQLGLADGALRIRVGDPGADGGCGAFLEELSRDEVAQNGAHHRTPLPTNPETGSAAPAEARPPADGGSGRFFRDTVSLLDLQERLRPLAAARWDGGGELRIWVAGCGTGEEAYTVAMLAAELSRADMMVGVMLQALAAPGTLPLRIFASENDGAALAIARRGIYGCRILADVPPDHLARYFVKEGRGWRVAPQLRDSVTFSEAAPGTLAAGTAPMRDMDLIVCRNLLESPGGEAQAGLLAAFRSALRPGGFLLLAPDHEMLDIDGFEALSPAPQLYRRTGPAQPRPSPPAEGGGQAARIAALEAAAEAFVPPTALINASGRILAALGGIDGLPGPAGIFPTSMFPGGMFPGGTPSRGASLADGLALPATWLRQGVLLAVAEAARTGQTVHFRAMAAPDGPRDGLNGLDGLDGAGATLRIQPLRHDPDGRLLVSFLETGPIWDEDGDGSPEGSARRVAALETENDRLRRELAARRQAAALERQEAWLRLEEARAIQDELTNRIAAAESAQENLQEKWWQSRNAELDLRSILASSSVVLMLDGDLNIRFFTPSDRLPFRLMPRDVGRPLADITPVVEDPDLLEGARLVLSTREAVGRELELPDGTWLMRRIHPYLRGSQVVGVVVSYADISETKAAAERAEAVRSLAVDLVRSYHRPLIVLDSNLHVVFANDAFRQAFGGDDDEIALRTLVGAVLRAKPSLATFLTGREDRSEQTYDSIIQVTLPAAGPRTLRVLMSRVPPGRTMLAVEDVTERVLQTAELENARAMAERTVRNKSRLMAAVSHDLRQPLKDIAVFHRRLSGLPNPPEMARRVMRLGFAVSEMTGMLDSLNDSAQLDMGTLEVSASTFPVGAVLDGLDADFAESPFLQGLRWRVVRSTQLIVSDAHLLRRALRHLISVLLRFTPAERIVIGCRRRGNRLRIEFWARGVKISGALIRAGLEPRDGGPPRERLEATTLELEVARRLGELLGHPFRIETPMPGQLLCVMEVPTGERAGSARAEDALEHRPGPVLIMVDDAELAGTLRLLLERDRYAALIATDGGQAVGLALEHSPALIITEFDLPGSMNGLDLARRIAGTREPPPAAILLTGDLDAATLRDIALSRFEHAPRTIDAEELLERVQRLLPHAPVRIAAPGGGALGRVFLVDGDSERRLGFLEWLERQGWRVEGFATTDAFLEADTPDRQGCVVADWATAEAGVRPLLAALRPAAHRLPTIIVTDQGDIQLAVRAVSAGAVDFLKRPVQRQALAHSIEKASAQLAVEAREQASRSEYAARLGQLTQRQREILDRVLAGSPNKIIAADLNLSQRTVENHRATLMTKLGARSLPELIRIVMGAR